MMKKHLRKYWIFFTIRPHNPRGYVGKFGTQGLRPGIVSGEGCDREVAAYLID
jgi:hypothetical protein